jgi:RNA polymerase sigma-70 factor, ECF subfamily
MSVSLMVCKRTLGDKMERTDSELLTACDAGDTLAFEELYDRHSRLVYRAALLVVRSPEVAEEVAQDAFLAVWQSAGRYDASRASVRTWLLRISRNLAVDRCRRSICEAKATERWLVREPAPESDPVGDHVAGWGEAGLLHQALAALPNDQRDCIERSFVEGCSHTEIAADLDVPLGTVKGRVRLGLCRLRASLAAPLGVGHG